MAKETITPAFQGLVTEDGKLTLYHPENLKAYLKTLVGEVKLTVQRLYKKRSNEENAYYWGVVIKLLSEEQGNTPDEMHFALRTMFLKKNIVIRTRHEGKQIILESARSTADLSTTEFEDYLSKIRTWAATDLQVNIPLPNEADFSDYYYA